MRRVAGREPRSGDALRVDYADVLAQAVVNERIRVLREVERVLNAEPVRKPGTYEFAASDVTAEAYRTRVRSSIAGMWPE